MLCVTHVTDVYVTRVVTRVSEHVQHMRRSQRGRGGGWGLIRETSVNSNIILAYASNIRVGDAKTFFTHSIVLL